MSLETRVVALASAIGADIKDIYLKQGSLASLTTTAQTSLVAAINELDAALAAAGVQIDDLATNGATTVTWSADKIFDEIEAAKIAVTNSLVNGAAAALDTLNELATALGNDPNFATTVATALTNRVRVDAAQTFTLPEMAQARANIDAASTDDLANLSAVCVRINEAQVFTAPEMVQARDNIGAAAAADLIALETGVGDFDHDFVADYTAAKV